MNSKTWYSLLIYILVLYLVIRTIHARHCNAIQGEFCRDPLNVNQPCKQCPPCKTGLNFKVKPISSKVCGDMACYPCKRMSRDTEKAKQHHVFQDKLLGLQAEPCTDETSKEIIDCKHLFLTMEWNNIVTVVISTLLLFMTLVVVLTIFIHIHSLSGTNDMIQTQDANSDADTVSALRFGRTAPQANTLEDCVIRLPLMEESLT